MTSELMIVLYFISFPSELHVLLLAFMQPEADYFCGLEGGCDHFEGHLVCFAWIVIKKKESTVEGKGRTGVLFLPHAVAVLVDAGKELGHACDTVFSAQNSKVEYNH